MKRSVFFLIICLFCVSNANASSLVFGGSPSNTDATYTEYYDSSPAGGWYATITLNTSNHLYYNGSYYNQCKTFLRFKDMYGTGIDQIPYGATITSAILTLHKYSVNGGNLIHDVYRVTSDWDESTLVYNTPVSIGSKAVSFTSPSSSGYIDIDLTNVVQEWSDGTENYGIMFKQKYDNYKAAFWSSDDIGAEDQRPILTVQFEGGNNPAVPEPLTIILTATGIIAAFVRKNFFN